MKKFVLLFCFFISISCLAQQRHLTFMGIPIDGTINTFEAKLKSKGMLPNTETNKSLPFGKRMFRGVYIGRNVNITVNYTGKTKTVYCIEIGFADENQNIVNNFESDFIEGVKRKYKDCHMFGEDNGSDKTIYVYKTKGFDNFMWENVVGILKTEWMTIIGKPKAEYSDLKEKIIRSVKIYYIDKLNLERKDDENASDI